MRRNRNRQLPLSQRAKNNPVARKYQVISDLLDEDDEICELAAKDLCAGKNPKTGRSGMTGEQAVRAAILYRLLGVSYEDFRFLVIESPTFRNFCRLPLGTEIGVSTLAENIKAIRPKTWEAIHEVILNASKKKLVPSRTAKLFESTALASQPIFTRQLIPPSFEIAFGRSPVFRKK